MATRTVERWVFSGGALRRPGRLPRLIDDGSFILETTRPVWKGTGHTDNNVGCLPGVSRTTVASVTQSAGAVHSNLTITGKVIPTAPNQHFFNCKFTYSSTGNGTGGLFQNQTTTSYPATFDRCEFEPASPWDRHNGLYGYHMTLTRCVVTKTVDGLGLYNPSGGPDNVVLHGCWIGQLSWYDNDYTVDPAGGSFPGGRLNGHDDGTGTHNDGIQMGGGSGLEVRGCFFQGAKYNGLNPTNVTLNSDNLTYTIANGNGVTPLDDTTGTYGFVQASQGILAKADVHSPVTNITVVNNWYWNWGHGVLLQTGSQQGSTPIVATITGNRFGGRWRDYGGYSRYYPIRYNTDCIVNGFQPGAEGSHADTFGNVWDASLHPSMTIGGSSIAGLPVLNRYDP